ncbi:MAG TPA: CDP-glucose 4,6-dehydratase [Bacilli bacterium]
MEGLGLIHEKFWRGRKVFITGHTGFKGTWLCLWLKHLGAEVTGYGLLPPTEPSLYGLCGLEQIIQSTTGDVRGGESVSRAMTAANPDIVIHMAAQSLVRQSYKDPVETYSTNVMGTVQVLEAVRKCPSVKAVISVTTDKCYENQEWIWGYRENDPLGGYDPYSSSKACSEMVTAAYRSSYFLPEEYGVHGVAVATVRSGNVIGGGDWAKDRLIPDCLRSLMQEDSILIRNPDAVRPWQHVLEPLGGYLLLAERLVEEGAAYASAWNFGPEAADAKPVKWIVEHLCRKWGTGDQYVIEQSNDPQPHETHYLKLDCTKSKDQLSWRPRWGLTQALDKIIEWTQSYQASSSDMQEMREVTLRQIREYEVGLRG